MTRFDAITLEILWTRLISIVDEAAKAIVRTSFSTLSNEANDFACMLTDARGGALAQNTGSIPSFIGTLPATVRHFLAAMGPEGMRPGDVLITNDAWMGTGHMSDVSVLKPIFRRERLVAFSATTSHMPDIGGRLRAIEAREIFEEGLHIPLTKLRVAGRTDETLVALIRANVRTPDQTLGDIWAQVGANELMERRLLALMEDGGLDGLAEIGDELFARAEGAMRAAIRAVPDGTYRYALRTDGVDAPLDFEVALTIRGEQVVADYAGTSPQQPRAINCVYAYTYAMTAYALKCALLPGLANNEGMYRPLRVVAPEGSILNPRFPAAVVSRAVTGHYVPPLLFGALHQVVPDRVIAAAGSPLWAVQQTGLRPDGRPYTNIFFFNGGMGATPAKDGESATSWPSNISSTPVEVAERNSPLFFRYKRLRPDSGGRGRFRGGLGQDILIECESDTPIVVSFMAERTRFAAPGLAGGGAGGLGDVRINGRRIDNRRQHVLREGDSVLVRTPGGAGYGPPSKRHPALEERDRVMGYVGRPRRRAPRRRGGARRRILPLVLALLCLLNPGLARGACTPSAPLDVPTALVLSGGGAKGAWEAGVAAELVERGLAIALVAGSSAGALNAAMVADGRVERLEAVWRSVKREQVYSLRASVFFAGLLPGWLTLLALDRAGSLLDPEPLRALIAGSVDLARVRASPVRLVVTTSDLLRRETRIFDNRTVTVDALMATVAVPGAFPLVELDGGFLTDGGLTGRAPVLDALEADPAVRRAVVVMSYAPSETGSRPTTVRRALEEAFELAMIHQIRRDTEHARLKYPTVDVQLLAPSTPLGVRPLDFDQGASARLLAQGRADAVACLEAWGLSPRVGAKR